MPEVNGECVSEKELQRRERAARKVKRRNARWDHQNWKDRQRWLKRKPTNSSVATSIYREANELQRSVDYDVNSVEYKIGEAFEALAKRFEGLR